MLEKFKAAKAKEIEELKRLERENGLPEPFTGPRPGFSKALVSNGPGAVIAEYKRASPSKGEINAALLPQDVAAQYAKAGAAALSVLTEEVYFKGSLKFLDAMTGTGLPLLRKDFIFHVLQIKQTAASPASALLLIVRMLEGAEELGEFLRLTHDLGLEAVTEVFDEADLEMARMAGAKIIQVNNRDLDTLSVSLNVSRRIIQEKREQEIWISASGVQTGRDIAELASLGFDAVLIGTSLMAGGGPGQALSKMVQEAKT
ncbi:MAG: indole-3-glycerol-phosphate synthase [Thermodesulfobacteriota bacterium]|nr:indole-3-glycerol-phosphate synthase [Thermodesulfobacteriota bacterium]